ncbi:MAG: hypothetical protein JWL59_4223 [Chthoniobacteraceae bacterium]|nr:hypothetical protein [Chthoniobacteraceae bacterium]
MNDIDLVKSEGLFKGKALKTLYPFLLALLLLAAIPEFSHAAEPGKYDVLAKTVMPFANVFARKTKDPNRALSIALRIEEMTGLPPSMIGMRGSLDVEFPDKVRLRAPVMGQDLTICRNGQQVWVYPGSKVAPLLEAANASGKLPPPDPKYQLTPFHLPVSEKELVFLPALFQVRDAGKQLVDETPCRVLNLQLMSQLGRALGVREWSAQAWITANNLPARLVLLHPGWEVSIRCDSVKFAPSLPASTWTPTVEQAKDVINVPASQYQQLLKLLANVKGKEG